MSQPMSTKNDDGANDPTFIAQCPECECLKACVVVTSDDETSIEQDEELARAIRLRAEWKRDGLKVSTVTVQAVREWKGLAFKHAEGCSRDPRLGRLSSKPNAGVQAALALTAPATERVPPKRDPVIGQDVVTPAERRRLRQMRVTVIPGGGV